MFLTLKCFKGLSFVVFILFDGNISLPVSESPIKVIAPGGNDVMLPCSLGMDIRSHSFDWAKDGLKVFVYTKSGYYLDMDKRFMERISHFKNQLQSGNASIMIQNTTMADSGNYTCNFPKLPQGQKTFHVELVVGEYITNVENCLCLQSRSSPLVTSQIGILFLLRGHWCWREEAATT
uniref:Ig-like domain-containing protein n=1 Tax=Echeneis naucrates TaxID=173247 RepID=A0A665TPA1_ECHNA